jgi:tRNA A58 N-methylase Trm61
MQENTSLAEEYALERAPSETRRLQAQAKILNPSTRRAFERAGITTGMKVLDLGSGAGDVALLLADMVGPQGAVIGVEIDPGLLATARNRAEAAGMTNISFQVGDMNSLELDTEFDALAGRLVLMHLRSPAFTLRKLVTHLRHGQTTIGLPRRSAHFFPLFSSLVWRLPKKLTLIR